MDEPGPAAGAMTAGTDADPRSTLPGPWPVPEADVFRFDPVDQVDRYGQGDEVDRPGPGAHGPSARRGLAVVFDEQGIRTSGAEPHPTDVLPWAEVTGVTFGQSATGDEGRSETPIEVESSAGLVRYLVRSDRPPAVAMAALAEQVRRWQALPEAEPDLPGGEPAVTADLPGVATATPTPPLAPRPSAARPPLPVPDGLPPGFPVAPAYGPSPLAPVDAAPAAPYAPTGPRLDRPVRTRRTVTLVVALCLVVSGIGLAVGLSLTSKSPPTTAGPPPNTAPAGSADQRLAEQLMLTRADLPAGWRVAKGSGAAANSPTVQQGEMRITRALARCMGITESQAAVVLGGQATDQTAQASSPIFVAPTSSASAGSALELQSAAIVVRSHRDEQADVALLANPTYPQCAATASAAELQLGVDQTSGGSDRPGPATVSTVTLPAPDGVQLTGLVMAFTVKAGTASIPVQVESISLGSHRVEANLQVFAIGGQIPNDTLLAPFSTFEQRVAAGGKSSVV